jgi:aryl-alcohol dehydrogenase-like predicted oxidoreductase
MSDQYPVERDRRLGSRRVPAVGLGAMPLSFARMADRPDQAIGTIHAALDLGVRLIDTAYTYRPEFSARNHNEKLVARALASWSGPRHEVVVATKGGIVPDPRGPASNTRDASREGLERACRESAQALGVQVIDLYYLHRLAPSPAFAEQVCNLRALKDDGLVKDIGLSNVTAQHVRVALDIVGGPADGGVAAVQNEFSPRYREDADVMALCAQAGVAYVAWSPFGGMSQAHDLAVRYAAFTKVARARRVSPYQVALAWILSLAPVNLVIPGATRRESITDSFGALDLALSPEEARLLSDSVPEGTSQYPDSTPSPVLGWPDPAPLPPSRPST